MENCEKWNREPDEIISSKIIEEVNEFHERHDQVLDCEECVYACGWKIYLGYDSGISIAEKERMAGAKPLNSPSAMRGLKGIQYYGNVGSN